MATTNYEWKTAIRDENINLRKELIPVEDHPLKVPIVTECITRRILGSQPSTGRTTPISTPTVLLDLNAVLEGIDPLTKFSIEEVDPLTKMAAEMDVADSYSQKQENKSKQKYKENTINIEPWSLRKAAILSKFTTSEKLSIVTSFLSEGEKVIVKAQSTSVDKVQHRLEQLDYFEEGTQKKFDLSQGEYVGRIEQLNKELVLAWNTAQRVKALKIAIQCAKLLSDTDVLCFYPSKFVLITDILDIFGSLVYERLRTKADYIRPGSKIPSPLPEGFTPDMVPDATKETCLNWFFKIASIRELVPRIYVEMAILKSYCFLTLSEYSDALLRLTKMIRGIGNPLVAVYARCYLCRVGISITAPNISTHYLIQNFYDFLDTYNHLYSKTVKKELLDQNMEVAAYFTLYTPALDFILQAVAAVGKPSLLDELLNQCQKFGNSPLLLNAIMAAFKPSDISERCLQFLEMIQESDERSFPSYLLVRTLGLCVSVSPPPSEQRNKVLSIVWKKISLLLAPENYISCAEVWIKFAAKYFTSREVNMIIGDIIQHMMPNKYYENYYQQLKNIVESIVSNTKDFETLLSMDNFLPLIDLFHQDVLRVEVCKTVLQSCVIDHYTSDPVITNALLYLCSVLHDSVNALTVDDERRQISEILSSVVRQVSYGKDFEKQLSFYVEARGAFSNLDMVLAQLVQCVNTLAANTRQIVKGYHTRKTEAFVRACAAYSFITIPSIASTVSRLELYLLSGKVALFNNSLEQAEACFYAALTTIPELANMEEKSRNTEAFLVSYIRNFLSTLLIVPDNPNKGVLDLMKTLLNTLKNYSWDPQNCSLPHLYLNVLDILSEMSQDTLPYSINKVESNNTIYGSDPKFLQEIDRMCSIILEEILSYMKTIGPGRKQSSLSLELFVRLLTRSNLKTKSSALLAYNLWQLSNKEQFVDKKYLLRTRDYFSRRAKNRDQEIIQQIFNRI